MTHYDTLGVAPDAGADEIRDAYRRLARRHHPDRADRPTTPATSMAAIDDAYRVLRDPGRRAVYDADVRGWGSATGATTSVRPTPDPVPSRPVEPLPPARMPWKLMAGMAVVGSAVVLVGAALRGTPDERTPDNLIGPGSCVVVEPNGDARETSCATADRVVVELVGFDERCPVGTEAHRDRQGRGIACLESVEESTD